MPGNGVASIRRMRRPTVEMLLREINEAICEIRHVIGLCWCRSLCFAKNHPLQSHAARASGTTLAASQPPSETASPNSHEDSPWRHDHSRGTSNADACKRVLFQLQSAPASFRAKIIGLNDPVLLGRVQSLGEKRLLENGPSDFDELARPEAIRQDSAKSTVVVPPRHQRRVCFEARWRREWDSNPRYGFP